MCSISPKQVRAVKSAAFRAKLLGYSVQPMLDVEFLEHRNLSSFSSFSSVKNQDHFGPLWTTLDHFCFPFTRHVRQSE